MRTFLICWLWALPVLAQFTPDEMMKPYAYTNEAGEVFTCRLSYPQFPVEGKKYPLVLFLHGSTACGTDNRKQIAMGLPTLLSSFLKQRAQVIVVAPQCPPGILNWWVTKIAMSAEYSATKEIAPSLEVALELCNHLVRDKQADPDRLYVTGLSLGGFGTWDAIQRYPEMFAAAIPISAGGDTKLAGNIASVPVWVFHSQDDKNVNVECSRRMVKALKAAGGKVTYTEYAKGGHNSWDRAYSDTNVVKWLLEQTRKKQPWWKFWRWF
ncbi:MAG: phospholipase [Kiritimatiellaeota bacterium]|nr:phospholipase [Kiritimatiellota bacterium]